MSFILPLLKSKLAALGAVLVVALIIVLWGPRVVGYKYRWWCYGIAALLVVGFLLYLLIKKLRARKNARMLEKFLNQQADDQLLSARPDVQDELTAIKEKLNRAIGILKKSRVARGRHGSEALYVLPWYMIIGPSASGKSTAIRNSGLHFPPVDPDSEDPGKVKGLGGTRNCDWWFTNEGIVLDTAGRYALSPNAAEDREEWSNFLKMLHKARPRAPINGLILAVSVDELLHQSAEGLEAHARAMRSRIDELIVKLEVLFPIYVVFTKCDLIAGFVEFFGDFTKGEREQVWGFTRKYGPSRRPLRGEFEQEFGQLAGVLERRRARQLAGEMRPAQKRGTYLFSVEFAAAGERLAAFIETLFQPNPYQQNPLVRGFYFTSGTQEGTPIAQVMEAMQRDFGLVSDFMAQFEPVKETKAYFIKDLFQEVILPDEAKVYPTTLSARRRRIVRAAALIGHVILTGLLILALGTSYVNNCAHNESLALTIKQVAEATAGKYAPSTGLLSSLDELREKLVQAESSRPLSMRWGLYSGDTVVRAGQGVYFQRYHDILLEPAARALATRLLVPLGAVPHDTIIASYFNTFTAYRMLTVPYDSAPRSTGVLRDQLLSVCRPLLSPDSYREFSQLTEKQTDYYWRHRPDATIRSLRASADQSALDFANQQMKSHWNLPFIYAQMISDISGDSPDYSYSEAAPSATRLTGRVTVRRAFTRESWEVDVRPRIERMPKEIEEDPIKKAAFTGYEASQIRQRLTEMYVSEFIQRWRAFIESGSVVPFRNLDDAVDGLKDFSGDNSPILAVLNKVYEQSDLKDLDKESAKKIEAQFGPLGRFLGFKIAPTDQPGKKAYLELLGSVPGKLKDIKGKLESNARCAEGLRGFGASLDDVSEKVDYLLSGSDLAKASGALLVMPVDAAKKSAFGGAYDCLDRQWKSQVLDFYNINVATMYPFNRSSEAGVPLANVADFFNKFMGFVSAEIDVPGAPPISGAFQTAIANARAIQQILARGRTKLQFTLTADAQSMSRIRVLRFRYSGFPTLEYVSGQPRPINYEWPQVGDATGELSIESNQSGASFQPLRFSGEWGVFHLFDQAEKSGKSLTWTFQSRDGQRQKAVLILDGDDAGFILSGHFTKFQCPQSVFR